MKKDFKKASLIQFSVENFGCFRNRVDFNMSTRKDAQNNFELNKTGEHLLKSAIIYGSNASGKTTLLDAMRFMGFKIRRSTDIEHSDRLKFSPFLMDEGLENKPSFFEIIFSLDNKIYKYNFSIMSDHTVVDENLFDISGVSEKIIFSRKRQKFDISPQFTKDKALVERTKENALFLSVADKWNVEEGEMVMSFFTKGFNILDGDRLAGFHPHTAEKSIEDSAFKEKVIAYLKYADFFITDFEVEKEQIPEEMRELLKKDKDIKIPEYFKTVNFSHPKYNKEKKQIGVAKISSRDESSGTLHFFGGLYPIIDSLEQGKVLIIDELNKHLHPHLCKFIVDLFHSKETNPNNAQLIFTTHDVTLLSQSDIDRDQFWFTEREPFGVASLFALSDFKERKGSDFQTRYLSGRYGALPFIDNSFLEK